MGGGEAVSRAGSGRGRLEERLRVELELARQWRGGGAVGVRRVLGAAMEGRRHFYRQAREGRGGQAWQRARRAAVVASTCAAGLACRHGGGAARHRSRAGAQRGGDVLQRRWDGAKVNGACKRGTHGRQWQQRRHRQRQAAASCSAMAEAEEQSEGKEKREKGRERERARFDQNLLKISN